MKILYALVLCALVGFSSHNLFADAVQLEELINGQNVWVTLKPGQAVDTDPRILVRRLRRGSVPFSGYSFSFTSGTGDGTFDFFNDNPRPLYELTFTITPGGPADSIGALFACGVGSDYRILPFSDCLFKQEGDIESTTVVSFFGRPGLPAFSHFAIDLQGFPSNTLVSAVATPSAVPEPATTALFLTGMGALLWKRRLPKSAA